MLCWTRSMPILRQCGRRWNKNSPARSSRITLIGLIIDSWETAISWDPHGRSNFISRLNQKFYAYAASHEHFYINDIDYLSADYGLTAWGCLPSGICTNMPCVLDAIPSLANSVANIIKSLYGRNKKRCARPGQYALGRHRRRRRRGQPCHRPQKCPEGQVYAEFQSYCKALKSIGVILAVDSKTTRANALAGLNHPDGVLRPDDFVAIKANWGAKGLEPQGHRVRAEPRRG